MSSFDARANLVSTLDIQGNWNSVNNNGTVQTRTHNKQNQATVVGGANLTYSNNGEMTVDETGKALTYDAWGRVVAVVNGGTHYYAYDALGRRVLEYNALLKDFYYSDRWQVLEERHGGSSLPKMQYVWSPVYVDAMVLRDRDATGDSALEERLYVQQDGNWNTTAVVWYNDQVPQWEVKERYAYEPYGKPFYFTAGWGPQGSSTVAWVYGHQSGRYESATGYVHFRNRDLSPAIGRWGKEDPKGFPAGDMNLYRYSFNGPLSRTDPTGLDSLTMWPRPNDAPISKDHMWVSVYQERQAGVYNARRDTICCTPLSIKMTTKGTPPLVGQSMGTGSSPKEISVNPWMVQSIPDVTVGTVIGGMITLEWVIEFNTNPRRCSWGRNVVTWYDKYLQPDGSIIIPNTPPANYLGRPIVGGRPSLVHVPGTIRDDSSPEFDFIVGNKVYMYDRPGSPLRSLKRLFEVWARSEDGKERISHWSYVDSAEGYREIDEPTIK